MQEIQNNVEFDSEIANEKRNLIQDLIKSLTKKIHEEKILVIDRFEGEFAVCEDRNSGEIQNINIAKLPENIKEGDVIKSKDNQYELDEETRSTIEERLEDKMKNLFED